MITVSTSINLEAIYTLPGDFSCIISQDNSQVPSLYTDCENSLKILIKNDSKEPQNLSKIEIQIGPDSLFSPENLAKINLDNDILKKEIPEKLLVITSKDGQPILLSKEHSVSINFSKIVISKSEKKTSEVTINLYKEARLFKALKSNPFNIFSQAKEGKSITELLSWSLLSDELEITQNAAEYTINNILSLQFMRLNNVSDIPFDAKITIGIRFDVTPTGAERWALCSNAQSKNIEAKFNPDKIFPWISKKWEIIPDLTSDAKKWTLKPVDSCDKSEDVFGKSLMFDFSKIVNNSQEESVTLMYLTFSGIPNYQPATFVLPIYKKFPQPTIVSWNTDKNKYKVGEDVIINYDAYGVDENGWFFYVNQPAQDNNQQNVSIKKIKFTEVNWSQNTKQGKFTMPYLYIFDKALQFSGILKGSVPITIEMRGRSSKGSTLDFRQVFFSKE